MADKERKKNFFARHFQTIAKAGIVFIPAIYTTLFLGSMWDPYGNVDALPVAVVNEDHAVEYNGRTLAVGDELVSTLREKQSLDFHFADSDDAMAGLEDGSYYMVITIPEDFSENASTLLDESPKKMELHYATNPGTNYIASKMSESALAKIEKEISSSVTESYAEILFNRIGETGDGFSDAADGAGKLTDGAEKLGEGNEKITENLQVLADSTLTFENGAKTLTQGVRDYTDGVARAADGSALLQRGTPVLSEGIKKYTDGVHTAQSGSEELNRNSDVLRQGSQKIAEGSEQIGASLSAVLSGVDKLSDGLNISLSPEKLAQTEQLRGGISSVENGISQLSSAVMQIRSEDLADAAGNIGVSADSIRSDTEKAENSLLAISAELQKMLIKDPELITSPEYNAIKNSVAECQADISRTKGQASVVKMYSQGISQSVSDFSVLKKAASVLDVSAGQVLPASSSAITDLQNGLLTVQGAFNGKEGSQTEPGIRKALSEINRGVGTLTESAYMLSDGIGEYSAGAEALNTGLKQLDSSSGQLVGGINELSSGASAVAEGLKQLESNSGTLVDGADRLKDGASQIKDGTSKLAEGSVTLGDGISEVKEGTEELHSALSDGAEEIRSIKTGSQTYQMFASPVRSEETYCTSVSTNGNAMAAYMMAVGLWVAGLALCIILDPHKRRISPRPAADWAVQTAEIIFLAVVQAVIMVLLLGIFNGFEPVYLSRTILVACVSSAAFLMLEYTLNYYCGVIGDFILLVMMVIQLSGCAGTYPKELSAGFYQKINPYLPFTYAVHGFRSGIASGQSVTKDIAVMTALFAVSSLLLLAGFIRADKKKTSVSSESRHSTELLKGV